jgi:hypothetical protein
MRLKTTLAAFAAVCALTGASAHAAVLHDQLVTNLSDPDHVDNNIMLTQRFESGFTSLDIASLDDFTLTQASRITAISAQILGISYEGAFDPAQIQNYAFSIYSSPAAGASSLTGDVANLVVSPADVTITPYADLTTPSLAVFLVRASVDIPLAAGTYWLGVTPRLDFQPDSDFTYILADAGQVGAGPVQVNPGAAFGFGASTSFSGTHTGFAIEGDALTGGVPEPASWALMIGGFGLAGATLRAYRGRSVA